jgi:predicted transcriptional regulator
MSDAQQSGVPVNYYMSEPVHWVEPDDDLAEVKELIGRYDVAGLAVVDSEASQLIGVISRTDVLRIGDLNAKVSDHMTPDIVMVKVDQAVTVAARSMVDNNVHRVFVIGAEGLVGVLSTTDLMGAVRDLHIEERVESYMSTPVFSIDVDEPISAARKLLAEAGDTGLVVRDDVWPVGLFSSMEALVSQDMDGETPVEHVMSQELVAVPASMPIYRVAGQAASLGVRRVVVMDHGAITGVLTGMDFARACADLSAS